MPTKQDSRYSNFSLLKAYLKRGHFIGTADSGLLSYTGLHDSMMSTSEGGKSCIRWRSGQWSGKRRRRDRPFQCRGPGSSVERREARLGHLRYGRFGLQARNSTFILLTPAHRRGNKFLVIYAQVVEILLQRKSFKKMYITYLIQIFAKVLIEL